MMMIGDDDKMKCNTFKMSCNDDEDDGVSDIGR